MLPVNVSATYVAVLIGGAIIAMQMAVHDVGNIFPAPDSPMAARRYQQHSGGTGGAIRT